MSATTLSTIEYWHSAPQLIVVAHGDWRGFCACGEESNVSLNELAERCHATAIEKGWYEGGRDFPELLVLLHSEISEALEEWRAGTDMLEIWYDGHKELINEDGSIQLSKPCGIPIEIADLIIRTLDMCGYYGIDIDAAIAEKMAYNELRPIRHGGKRI